MSDSIVSQMAILYVQDEYKAMDYDTDQIQTHYLLSLIHIQFIEQALLEEGNEDETDAIQRLLEKKGYTPEMPREQANKIYQFLLRRGYKSSDILYVMRSEYLT